jgi:integrase
MNQKKSHYDNRALHQAIDGILQKHARASAGGNSGVGLSTHNKRAKVIHNVYHTIEQLGYRLQKPENLKQSHIRIWLHHLKSQGLAEKSTILRYTYHLKAFCVWMGKNQHVWLLDQAYEIVTGKQKHTKPSSSVRRHLTQSLFLVLEKNKQNKHHVSKDKKVSISTTSQRREFYVRFCVDLIDLGYNIKRVSQLRQKHICAWLRMMEEKGASAATLQKYASFIKTLTVFIGKPEIMGDPRDYLVDPRCFERTYVATEDKSDQGKAKRIDEILVLLAQENPIISAQYDIAWQFGLRFAEAAKMKPHQSDLETQLHVVKGTKGGRPRTIAITTDAQRQALESMKELATSPNSSTIPKTKSYAQWRAHCYYVYHKVGLTKKEAGFTFHGLRHSAANKLYEQLAGIPSPVRGGNPQTIDLNIDKQARLEVSKVLGHSRERISTAYIGSTTASELTRDTAKENSRKTKLL